MKAEKFPVPTILIVDDEQLIRWSLKESFCRTRYRILEAQDGRGTLQHFNGSGEVDLVLLDVRLPDSNGLDVLQRIKQADPGCPVILMTAYGTPELMDEATAQGAYRVVGKPFNVEEMVSLAEEALNGRSS